MRLYGPAIILLLWALLLALFGDGKMFTVTGLIAVAITVIISAKAHYKIFQQKLKNND